MKDKQRFRLLTEQQIQEWFQLPISRLRRMRYRPGKDPLPFVKIGGAVRYREDQVLQWLERNTFDESIDANVG